MEERAQLEDLQNLYVYSSQGPQKVPLSLISSIDHEMQTEKIWRRNQFRAVTVGCFPVPGVLPSQVMNAARSQLMEFEDSLPTGYKMEIAGAEEKQVRGFREISIIMLLSATAIYLALLIQFRHSIKPFVLFTAIPYGMVGALALLWGTGAPLGFMALLGLASLIGLITSQAIVLFDSVEGMREQGKPLYDALLDSGIVRMRPVIISVSSTVFGLLPLALKGGPLWEPMTYAQIGGLTLTAFIILLLVPVLYAIFVLDLKLVKWETPPEPDQHSLFG